MCCAHATKLIFHRVDSNTVRNLCVAKHTLPYFIRVQALADKLLNTDFNVCHNNFSLQCFENKRRGKRRINIGLVCLFFKTVGVCEQIGRSEQCIGVAARAVQPNTAAGAGASVRGEQEAGEAAAGIWRLTGGGRA
jgi:hypothetical protein